MNESIQIGITHLFTSQGHDFFGRYGKGRENHETISKASIECVAGKGILGDRFFGYKENYPGQITFLSQEVIDDVVLLLGLESVDVSAFRRNAIVFGVDLNELIGKVFEIDGIVFEGVKECSPCFWMNEAIGEGAETLLKGRGGLRCRILESGRLNIGTTRINVKTYEASGAGCIA